MVRSNHDPHATGTAGAANASADTQDTFDPGPNVIDDTGADPASGGLPSWLKSFAEATGTEPSASRPASADGMAGRPVDRQPVEPPDRPRDTGTPDFFTDDDLPEWLRALTVEPAGEQSSASWVAADPSSDATIAVPATSRAWISDAEAASATPDASLFAAITHEADQRPDAFAAGADADARHVGLGASGAAPAHDPKVRETIVPVSSRAAAARSRRLRLWLLAALIIVLAFVFIMLNSN